MTYNPSFVFVISGTQFNSSPLLFQYFSLLLGSTCVINELFFLFFLFRECCAAYPARAGLSVAMTVLFESTFFSCELYLFFLFVH